MLIGEKNEFAIEIEAIERVDDWVLGRFLFWLGGMVVGDPADESVHLIGCVGWLREFVENPRDRHESGLYAIQKDLAFSILNAGMVADEDRLGAEAYPDTFSRFHISHLGMSSFDRVTLLLVEDKSGRQRCIWQQELDPVQEAFLPPGRMQQVARDCVERFSPRLEEFQT
jgi:hypothetical protein